MTVRSVFLSRWTMLLLIPHPAAGLSRAPLGASHTHAAATAAPHVSGRVTDDAGRPIAGATVSLVELGRSTTADVTGRFVFPVVPAGRYTLSARRLGYRAAARTLTVGDETVETGLALHAGASWLDPVNVTASRTATPALVSPLPTSVLAGEQLRRDAGVSLAHSLERLPGVRNLSTGQQVGKPMIRGLVGPRVLVLDDGSRLEDYSWSDEDGPTIDARMAQRVEVIRGPASVLYGSEALGGVVNVIAAELPFSSDGDRVRRTFGEVYGGSNNRELGAAVLTEGAMNDYGWRLQGAGRFAQNFATPTGELGNSSFWSFNGEGAIGRRGEHGTTTLRAAHYGGEFHLLEASGPEAADPNGGPVRQTLDDRLQLVNSYQAGAVRFETKAQWQRHELTEVSDDCVPAPGQTSCMKVKDQQAFDLVLNTGTLDLLAHHTAGSHLDGTAGISALYQLSASSGPITLVPGATTNALGAYLLERATWGPVAISSAIRGDTRHLSSDASVPLGLVSDSRSWSASSADVGLVVRATESLALIGNLGSGWRAPTLFDLYTNGPNLAEARYEVGDPTLRTERARNADVGMRWASARVRAEGFAFRNRIADFIYLTPTTVQQAGLLVHRHVQANALLAGAEGSLEVEVADPLTLRASHDFVNGTDERSNTPLPLMPPPRSTLSARVALTALGMPRGAWAGIEAEHVATQSRLNSTDLATPGYTLLNLGLSTDATVHGRSFRLDVDIHNATNRSYRDFLSRYKRFASAPGANLVLRVSSRDW